MIGRTHHTLAYNHFSASVQIAWYMKGMPES